MTLQEQGDKDLKATKVYNGEKERFVKLHTTNASIDIWRVMHI